MFCKRIISSFKSPLFFPRDLYLFCRSKSILCIGATLVDELYFSQNTTIPDSSNPATKSSSVGGVISNIAQHLAYWVGYYNQQDQLSSLQLAHSLAMEVLEIKGAKAASITAYSLLKIKNNYYHD
ncbi:hypothetical protein [Flavobacterium sp.]|uniref:hypothetical protein n=1 Tax=Flavobacterium sp. TaxID=239 RepID=UPI003BE21A25